MKRLLREIHERSLWQVLGIYLAGSWIALQVVNEVGDAVGLPPWVSGGAVVLLVIGFPIVLATTFIQHRAGPAARPIGDVSAETSGGAPTSSGPEVTSAERPAPPASPSRRHHRLFTWRNAILGGAAAFTLFALGTGAWMALRALGIGAAGTLVAKGALEESALVILADFEAQDPTLGDAATQALRVDLAQSGIIRLATPDAVADALGRMGRDPSEPLTPALARELAVREGAGAVVTGEVNPAGVGHVFSAEVVATDGTVLTSQRESASDDTDVIPAIDRLSKKLRERMGESFRSIRANPPLERVTTSSLDALKLYSQASETGDQRQRIALLEQAVALDSGFAMAWRNLGIIYNNRQEERAKMVDAFTRAFEARDRLTERERRLMSADYYTLIEFDPQRASIEYEAVLDLDPDDPSAIMNLGVMYSEMGDHERSAEYALRGMGADPESFTGYWNSVTSLVNLGRLDEAQAIVDSAARVFGADRPRFAATMIQQARGDLDGVEATWRWFLELPVPDEFRADLSTNLAAVVAARGRPAEAEDRIGAAVSIHDDQGRRSEALEAEIQAAWIDLAVLDAPDLAMSRVDEALERFPLEELAPLDRPYTKLAELAARAGRVDRARAILEEMRAAVDPGPLARHAAEIRQTEGEIALLEGRTADAIPLFRRATAAFCHICPLPGLARAYEAAGQPDSAIAVYRRYAETPYSDRFQPYTYPLGPALGPTYERLGVLYDAEGDLDNAARFYASFVELWADAEAALQPRVRAAQARLEEILEARG